MPSDLHDELVERAERWLWGSQKCQVVLRELTTYADEIPDVIGFGAGFSTVVECKVSRADWRADQKKSHRRYRGMGNRRFYFAPKGMLAPEEMQKGWGLLEPWGTRIRKRRVSSPFTPDLVSEQRLLVSALTRVALRGHLPDVYEPYMLSPDYAAARIALVNGDAR